MNLQEITRETVNWIYLASDREKFRAVVNAVYELRIQQDAENFLTCWGTIYYLLKKRLLHVFS